MPLNSFDEVSIVMIPKTDKDTTETYSQIPGKSMATKLLNKTWVLIVWILNVHVLKDWSPAHGAIGRWWNIKEVGASWGVGRGGREEWCYNIRVVSLKEEPECQPLPLLFPSCHEVNKPLPPSSSTVMYSKSPWPSNCKPKPLKLWDKINLSSF
jgi:hypothetical protein